MKQLTLCVTNDLVTDQRMARICSSLQAEGWAVTLVGRRAPGSPALTPAPYQQIRLPMFFSKGKLFYIEFNIRLLVYLLFHKMDMVVAIDLDTIVPCYYASRWKGIQRAYDAHELFTELKEVVSRPRIHRFWLWVERSYVPKFPIGYTVSQSIVEEFRRRYGVEYALVRNMPLKRKGAGGGKRVRNILYQGAVNEGRGFEWLIPAMKNVDAKLLVYGEGNFSNQCKQLIAQHGLTDKVLMMGAVRPEELTHITDQAYIGINLVEPLGLNQLYSLANKFFDYIQAGVPQLTMDFPEYRRINDEYHVAVLIPALSEEIIASGLNKLLDNEVFYEDLTNNCTRAAEVLNWQQEEKTLKALYHKILD